MENMKWRFISNGNATYTGINDSGMSNFKGDYIDSLVREVVQNSLDAISDKSKPVTVEFSSFSVNKNVFPDYENFSEILNLCMESQKGIESGENFFKDALKIFGNEYIDVLRVSDFNTKGLEGANEPSCLSTWKRLVKGSGVPNQNATAGGSFGIGKSAPFRCSKIRTVFYVSKDIKNIDSSIGVCRLVTFPDENLISEDNVNGYTTGMGFCSENNKKEAILKLLNFEEDYKREESGTDLYIMCLKKEENLLKKIVKSVLWNFLVSVWNENLIVSVKIADKSVVINKNTIEENLKYIEDLFELKEGMKKYSDLKNHYDLLRLPESEKIKKFKIKACEYGEKYGFNDDEAILYLLEVEKGNRRVLTCRSAGMRLFDMSGFSSAIPDFTGILQIVGDNMNAEFRNMETPTHDDWDSNMLACEGKESHYEKMKGDLTRYIKGQVKKEFLSKISEKIDAYGVADFLPDSIENQKEGVENFSDSPTLVKNEMKFERKAHSNQNLSSVSADFGGNDTKARTSKKHIKDKSKKKNVQKGNGNLKGYFGKRIEKVFVIPLDAYCGRYSIKFNAQSNKNACIQIDIATESGGEIQAKIKTAKVLKGDAIVSKINKNCIFLKQMIMARPIVVEFELDFDRLCKLKVGYYEKN